MGKDEVPSQYRDAAIGVLCMGTRNLETISRPLRMADGFFVLVPPSSFRSQKCTTLGDYVDRYLAPSSVPTIVSLWSVLPFLLLPCLEEHVMKLTWVGVRGGSVPPQKP